MSKRSNRYTHQRAKSTNPRDRYREQPSMPWGWILIPLIVIALGVGGWYVFGGKDKTVEMLDGSSPPSASDVAREYVSANYPEGLDVYGEAIINQLSLIIDSTRRKDSPLIYWKGMTREVACANYVFGNDAISMYLGIKKRLLDTEEARELYTESLERISLKGDMEFLNEAQQDLNTCHN